MNNIDSVTITNTSISSRNEPAWLESARTQALEVYNDRAIPSTAVEAWKYTNLRRFKPENFQPAKDMPAVSSVAELPAKIRDRLSSTDAAVAGAVGEEVGELLGFCGVGVLFDCLA